MKIENSKSAVIAAINSHRDQPFEYGAHDCGILVADAVWPQIGHDIARKYRGNYTTRAELDVLLAADGYKSHVDILADLFEEIPYSQAVTGDVAAVEGDDGTLVTGVINGPYIFVFGYRGVGAIPLSRAVRTFKVEIR
jgi:hypothetical protein